MLRRTLAEESFLCLRSAEAKFSEEINSFYVNTLRATCFKLQLRLCCRSNGISVNNLCMTKVCLDHLDYLSRLLEHFCGAQNLKACYIKAARMIKKKRKSFHPAFESWYAKGYRVKACVVEGFVVHNSSAMWGSLTIFYPYSSFPMASHHFFLGHGISTSR